MIIGLRVTVQEWRGVGIVDCLSKKLDCEGNLSYVEINSYMWLRKSFSLMIEV